MSRVTISQEDILSNLKKHISELAEVEQITKSESATELARYYIQVRDFYEALDGLNTELSKLKIQMAQQDLPAAFEREGITTLTLERGYRVTISALVRASTKDMATAIDWCKKNGAEGLVKETINAQTLAAFVRSEMEEGREVPDTIFTVSVGQNTSVTKVK